MEKCQILLNGTDLEHRAIAAYYRYAPRKANVPKITAWPNTVIYDGRVYVILSSGSGVMAIYHMRNDGNLRRIKRPPEDVLNWCEGNGMGFR